MCLSVLNTFKYVEIWWWSLMCLRYKFESMNWAMIRRVLKYNENETWFMWLKLWVWKYGLKYVMIEL
jgi:hypothetical protein